MTILFVAYGMLMRLDLTGNKSCATHDAKKYYKWNVKTNIRTTICPYSSGDHLPIEEVYEGNIKGFCEISIARYYT